MSELREISKIILYDNSSLFIKQICRFYPLSEAIVNKYSDVLDWNQLNKNTNLEWSDEFFKSMTHKKTLSNPLFPMSDYFIGISSYSSKNIKINWSSEILNRYKEKLNWRDLSMNSSLPWSIVLIDEFKEYWDWIELSSNRTLPWSIDLIDYFIDSWIWIKPENSCIELKGLAMNSGIKWDEELIEYYWEYLKIKDVWYYFPRSEGIVWSNSLFEKYDWNRDNYFWPFRTLHFLSFNSKFPWTKEFIKLNIDKLSWAGLSVNKGLPWDESFFNEYYSTHLYDYESLRQEGFDISINEGIEWTEEILINHINKIEKDAECAFREFEDNYDDDVDSFDSNLWPGVSLMNDYLISNKGIYNKFFSHFSEELIEYHLINISSSTEKKGRYFLGEVELCIYNSKLSIRLLFKSKEYPDDYSRNYIRFIYDSSDIKFNSYVCKHLPAMFDWVRFMVQTSNSKLAIDEFNNIGFPYTYVKDENGNEIIGKNLDIDKCGKGNFVLFETKKMKYNQEYALVQILDFNDYLNKLYPILKLIEGEEFEFVNLHLRGANYQNVKYNIIDSSVDEDCDDNYDIEQGGWDSLDIRKNGLYDDNLDMDQQNPNIW